MERGRRLELGRELVAVMLVLIGLATMDGAAAGEGPRWRAREWTSTNLSCSSESF